MIRFFRTAILLLIVATASTAVAEPTLPGPVLASATIRVGQLASKIIRLALGDPTYVAGSARLERVDGGGLLKVLRTIQKQRNVIWALHYTFNEPAAGDVYVRVTAQFSGQVAEVASPTVLNNTLITHDHIDYDSGSETVVENFSVEHCRGQRADDGPRSAQSHTAGQEVSTHHRTAQSQSRRSSRVR